MIINQCVEEGVYVVLLLSLQKDHQPLRSTELSTILCVSDSYLKKILRKLVLADIIVSNPGREGGFQLSRSVEEITLFDIYTALEGRYCDLKMTGIGKRIFIYGREFSQGEDAVVSVFGQANEAFLDELRSLSLSELVSKDNYLNGTIDFRENCRTGQE